MDNLQSISRINRPSVPSLFVRRGRHATTAENRQVVQQALDTYCYLLRSLLVPGTTLRLGFSEFADRIEAHLGDLDETQRETVRKLREVDVFSASYPLPPNGMEQYDNAIWASDSAEILWENSTCAPMALS